MATEIFQQARTAQPTHYYDIGRAVDPEWLGSAERELKKALPRKDNGNVRVNLQMREDPGIVHVLWQLLKKESYRRNQSMGRAADSPLEVAQLLGGAEIDEQVAIKGLTVTVRKLHLVRGDRMPGYHFKATVGDVPSPTYSGFVVAGERDAFWRALTPEARQWHPRLRDNPEHTITLGTVTNVSVNFNATLLPRLQDSLDEEVYIGPVREMLTSPLTPRIYPFTSELQDGTAQSESV